MNCIAYITNENSFYRKMLLNSIRMVRAHNLSIPIHVFLVMDDSRLTIPRENLLPDVGSDRQWLSAFNDRCEELSCEVHTRPPLEQEGDGDFFHLNRCYLGAVECDSLLYLDADTFVFGDLDRLFQDYVDCDLTACEAKWVYGRKWQERYLPNLPISSGVLLFNNRLHQSWASSLPRLIAGVRQREYLVSEFVYSQHGDALLREEFATNQWAADRKVRYFAREDVHLIFQEQEVQEVGKSLVFHCYTPNWSKVSRQVEGPAKRVHRRLLRSK